MPSVRLPGSRSPSGNREAARFRPRVESLEDRESPSLIISQIVNIFNQFTVTQPPAGVGGLVIDAPPGDVNIGNGPGGPPTGMVSSPPEVDHGKPKIAICHHTSSAVNGFVLIRIPLNAVRHHFDVHGFGLVHDTHGGIKHESHADKFPVFVNGVWTCDDGHPQDEKGDADKITMSPDFPALFMNNPDVTVNGSSGKDRFNINMPRPPEGLEELTINGGAGRDTFDLKRLPAGVHLTIDGGARIDTVILPRGVSSAAELTNVTFISIERFETR